MLFDWSYWIFDGSIPLFWHIFVILAVFLSLFFQFHIVLGCLLSAAFVGWVWGDSSLALMTLPAYFIGLLLCGGIGFCILRDRETKKESDPELERHMAECNLQGEARNREELRFALKQRAQRQAAAASQNTEPRVNV